MIVEISPAPPAAARRLAAVVFTDIVDSVGLIQRDADGTISRWRTFVATITHEELPKHRGRIVKLLGDGMLVEFASAAEAVECALAFQQRIADVNEGVERGKHIALRTGVHVADVLADDLDLYGDGVNLAARLMAIAGGGETIISGAVRDQVTDGLGVQVEDLGDQWLKGMERPVRAFRAWPPGPVSTALPDRRRVLGGRPSIAVLPFRDLSSDGSHAFLGDILAEDLIGALSRQTDIFVTSRLSTTPFRNRLYEPRNVAEMLGVRYLLSGTMQTGGGRMRLIAELTEADVGRVIWADRLEGSLDDLFDLEDTLSHEIADRVIPLVRQRELQRARAKRPENLTAYERTLRAIDDIHRSSPENLQNAYDMLIAAIASDPQYAAPHAWLALYHVRRVGQGWSADRSADVAAANREASLAMERDETNSWVLAVNGLVQAYLNKDLDSALASYDRALAINPSEASAWAWSAAACAWLGDGAEAVRRAPRAIELSPFDPAMYSFTSMAGMAYLVAADYEVALGYLKKSLRLNRMFSSTHRLLTIALVLLGRHEEASAAARDLLAVEPSLTVTGFTQRFPGAAMPQSSVFADALLRAGVPR
ncbi:MAG: adenylate/guanylate cyclase domain-containing protein [Burkholderiales bacterium]